MWIDECEYTTPSQQHKLIIFLKTIIYFLNSHVGYVCVDVLICVFITYVLFIHSCIDWVVYAFMNWCIYVCIHSLVYGSFIYLPNYVCMHGCIYSFIHLFICMFYLCIHSFIYLCIFNLCIYRCIYVLMYVCIYLRIFY